VDDLVLLDRDRVREKLEEAQALLAETLASLRMRLQHEKTRLVPTREGFTFVGYRILPWGTRLPRAILSRTHRRLHGQQRAAERGRTTLQQARSMVAGVAGHALPAKAEAVMASLLEAHPFRFPEKSPGWKRSSGTAGLRSPRARGSAG
jgi:hypothetical protein